MLELQGVVKSYVSGVARIRAADGVSLRVEAGEFIAVYGPSGSGKSTLLMIAAGIARPDAGTVLFDRRDLAHMTEREGSEFRSRQLGMIFQSAELIPGATALDNATVKLLGRGVSRRRARKVVRPWLDRVGLGERSAHRPAQLSTGERQRVAIARALANDPKLVLADEPTGNLDSESGRSALTLLSDLRHERDVSIVLATHDPAALEFADRAYILRDGRLAELSGAERLPAGPHVLFPSSP